MSPILTTVRAAMRSFGDRLHATAPRALLTVSVTSAAEAVRWSHWGSYGERLRMLVRPRDLVMQGGFAYGTSHPFVAALAGGRAPLEAFYAAVCPASLAELHGLPPGDGGAQGLAPWEVPWIQRLERSAPPGEAGLGPEHGVSFYGPASTCKVDLELRRLTDLRNRIATHGYRPDEHGDIQGYFMIDDGGQFRFFVRGGKHRAAVLVHLGHDPIPVAFKPDWPRLVSVSEAASWPLVQDALLGESEAQAVFHAYFATGGRERDVEPRSQATTGVPR